MKVHCIHTRKYVITNVFLFCFFIFEIFPQTFSIIFSPCSVYLQEPYAESSYTDSLTIHPGADVRDPRIVKVGSAAAPTPSSVSKVRLEPPIMMEPTGTVSKGGYIEVI